MNERTPGPWMVKEDRFNLPVKVMTQAKGPYGSELLVAHIYGLFGDARLIAAAPELLDALRALVRHDLADDERQGLQPCLELEEAREVLRNVEGDYQ